MSNVNPLLFLAPVFIGIALANRREREEILKKKRKKRAVQKSGPPHRTGRAGRTGRVRGH